MTVGFNPNISGQGPGPLMDPDAYARKYAEENGISLDEAKQQLRLTHGDPQRGGMETSSTQMQGGPQRPGDPDFLNVQAGISGGSVFGMGFASVDGPYGNTQTGLGLNPFDADPLNTHGTTGMDPESYARQYAAMNNISIEEARDELRSRYGDPQKPSFSVEA